MTLDVGQIKVRGIIGIVGVHVEAVPSSSAVRTDTVHHFLTRIALAKKRGI
jgi:hypothetical protein